MKMKQEKKAGIIKLFICFVTIFVMTCCFYQSTYASWVEDENGIHYKDENGEFVTGFQVIDGSTYYFSKTGNLLKGKIYVEDQGAYYFADEKGKILYGVIDDGNNFYVTDDSGKIKTGFVDYNHQRYYFDSSADMKKGWFKDENDWYYTDEKGRIMVGFVNVDGYRYYLSDGGKRVSNTVMDIDGTTYVFNKDGSVNENATALYPWIYDMNEYRKSMDLPELSINTKVQACAILRAADLVNGYSVLNESQSLKNLLSDRGVSTSGGYEFSYGGVKGYQMEQLLQDIKKDKKFLEILQDETITDVGVGVYEQDDICYYDVVLIRK